MGASCTPAADVYGGPQPLESCLPYTGHPILGVVLLGLALIALGMMVLGAQMVLDARAHADARRQELHASNPLIGWRPR